MKTPTARDPFACALVASLIALLPAAATAATPCIWEPMIGPSLMLTDDSTTLVALGFSFPFQGASYTDAYVSSNGFVSFSFDPGSGCCDADLAAFLSGPPRICMAWHDMNPSSGGQVTFQSLGTYAVVTWEMVPEYSASCPSCHTMQMLLYDNGDIVLAYDVLEPDPVPSGGHRHHGLVGITPGGGAVDPGEIDFSMGLPFSSGATGTVYEFFDRGPNGATGPDADPFDLSSSVIQFSGNPMGGYSATGCNPGAVVELRTVDAVDTTVAQGTAGHVVSVTAENVGGNDADLSTVILSFTGTLDRTPEYTVTPDPLNPTIIVAGATEVFAFLVDVSPSATIETITIDAEYMGADPIAMIAVGDIGADVPDQWDVTGTGCGSLGGVCGDCNSTGGIPDILDALAAAQIAAGLTMPTILQQSCCDVNSSMAVDVLDALGIAQDAAGLPSSLVCP